MNYTFASWPSERWPNFSFSEIVCRETGQCAIVESTMDRLQEMRSEYGYPLPITSGYRHPSHSKEINKPRGPGPHALGRAFDISCAGSDAYDIVALAIRYMFTGIGVSQKGEHRYIHVDDLGYGEHTVPRPSIWSY